MTDTTPAVRIDRDLIDKAAHALSGTVLGPQLFAALRARSEPEAGAVAWKWEQWSSLSGKWSDRLTFDCPADHKSARNVEPLYASPAPSDASATERMRTALKDASANLCACAETMRDIRRQTVADGKVRYELALGWAERAEQAAALGEA